MVNYRRKLGLIALVAIVLSLFSHATLAYYTNISTATNVVTSGGIRFLIHETTDQGTPFPEGGVYVIPGDVVSKKVNIQSDCTQPFYLRVKLLYGVDSQELTAEECLKLNINEDYWQHHDGWYYYCQTVEPGETTPYIFSQVEIIGDKVDNRYIGKVLSLTVNAQAVQSENNPLVDGNIYTASGWPQE